MASVYRHKSKAWYVAITLPGSIRKHIYLGKITKAQAELIGRRLQQLLAGNMTGIPPDPELSAWLSCCSSVFLDRIEPIGLLALWRRPKSMPKLVDYWEYYLTKRTDFSDGTRKNWRSAKNHVEAAFGETRLGEITVEDARQYSRDLLTAGTAKSTLRQLLNYVRQVHNAAIDAGLITENPFADVRMSAKVDPEKRFHVTHEQATKVAAAFVCDQARLIFLLARYCGLRVPHEPLSLTWDCVDWELGRLNIPRKTKTGHRVIPIFPEVLPTLERVHHVAPKGATYIITRARDSCRTVWRSWLLTAISDAGEAAWPELWQNLRRSARTDLEDLYPNHVCNAWIGHSEKVASKHYLMITKDHWETAKSAPRAEAHTAPDTARVMSEER
jgi:integrase